MKCLCASRFRRVSRRLLLAEWLSWWSVLRERMREKGEKVDQGLVEFCVQELRLFLADLRFVVSSLGVIDGFLSFFF